MLPLVTPRSGITECPSRTDYVPVAIHSRRLVHALRDVPALHSYEAVFEERPPVDARDLFLARADIREHIECFVDMAGCSACEDTGAKAAAADQLDVLLTFLEAHFAPTRVSELTLTRD